MADNWKNILIMKRLGLVESMVAMGLRVGGLGGIQVEGNGCARYLQALFTQHWWQAQGGVNRSLLQYFFQTLHLASYLYGVYDITIEIYLAEISLILLNQNNFEDLIFVENLLQMIENKLQKNCGLILLMDYEYDYLFKLMSAINLALIQNYFKRP